MTDLIVDDEKIAALEQAGLLKGRYYIVLEPLEDEHEDEDGFAIRAYATRDTQVEVDGPRASRLTEGALLHCLGAN